MIQYTEELKKILKRSEFESISLYHPYVGTEHFILGVLYIDSDIKRILNNHKITYSKMHENIKKIHTNPNSENCISYSPLLKKILNVNKKLITLKDAFLSLLQNSEGIALSIFLNEGINIDELYNEILNNNSFEGYGYSLNSMVKNNEINNVYERDKEIDNIINILARKNKCNPLLIGEAGVGKTAIVEGLAYRIEKNEVPDILKNKTIISINLPNVVGGTKYRGEFEEKIDKLIKKVTNNDNIILFIDEIHTIVGAGGAEGAIDASNILKPYLARNSIKCIGSTTLQEYNKSIKNDKALDRRFNKVFIAEPDKESLKKIIYGIAPSYERYHKVKINKKCLDYIIDQSKKLYPNKFEPDRTIDLLDELCAKIKLNNNKHSLYEKRDKLLNQKESLLTNKEYNKAIVINKKIKEYDKLINSYSPNITIEFINKVIKKDEINSIGFK